MDIFVLFWKILGDNLKKKKARKKKRRKKKPSGIGAAMLYFPRTDSLHTNSTAFEKK